MSVQVPAINDQDNAVAVEVSEAVFGTAFNEALVHQLVTRYLAGARSGTKAQKNRAAVNGGGSKPWRQKGTGRARAGTKSSPIWRAGGVTFAAQPRNHAQKLNKKMFRVGIKSILSELLRQNRLVVSNDILAVSVKTKELHAKLKGLDCKRILIVTNKDNENLHLASRNLPYVELTTIDNLSPALLVAADKVITTGDALQQLEGRLS
jgi:large subunit ribosomal protein L4